jgi:hypothetical protein
MSRWAYHASGSLAFSRCAARRYKGQRRASESLLANSELGYIFPDLFVEPRWFEPFGGGHNVQGSFSRRYMDKAPSRAG